MGAQILENILFFKLTKKWKIPWKIPVLSGETKDALKRLKNQRSHNLEFVESR